MIKHAIVTLAATFIALGTLIALPSSVTSVAHSAPVAPDRAAECAAALTDALPELRDTYSDICNRGYAIEGVSGRSYGTDMCAESITAELDTLQEGTSAHIPGAPWQAIVADCAAMGTDAAYVKYVGPVLPLCAFEDGSGSQLPCLWNARTQGNGRGTSYVVTMAP
jgi:hypothetical protein